MWFCFYYFEKYLSNWEAVEPNNILVMIMFSWSIDRTDVTDDNQFSISDQTGVGEHLVSQDLSFSRQNIQSGYDDMGYVRDRYSEIDFEINEYFLNNLRDNHNIDVNPESGQFTFDLTCKSEQGDNGDYNSEEVRTRITVHRTFHPDRLTNNQIGMIGKSAST